MSCGIDVCIYVNGRSSISEVGVIFEYDNYVKRTLNNQHITLDRLKDMIRALLELSPIQLVSSLAYKYSVE